MRPKHKMYTVYGTWIKFLWNQRITTSSFFIRNEYNAEWSWQRTRYAYGLVPLHFVSSFVLVARSLHTSLIAHAGTPHFTSQTTTLLQNTEHTACMVCVSNVLYASDDFCRCVHEWAWTTTYTFACICVEAGLISCYCTILISFFFFHFFSSSLRNVINMDFVSLTSINVDCNMLTGFGYSIRWRRCRRPKIYVTKRKKKNAFAVCWFLARSYRSFVGSFE